MVSSDPLSAYQRFIKAKQQRFASIASKTRNEYTIDDIESIAWLTALEVSEKLDIPVDFDDPFFQDRVLAFLYVKLATRVETVVRYSVRLDKPINGEAIALDDHPALRKLAASEYSDPLQLLIAAEESQEEPREHEPHESRAGAYLHLLRKFDNRMRDVAEHLLISLSYCYFRYNEALAMVERQLPLSAEGSTSASTTDLGPWRPFRMARRVRVEHEAPSIMGLLDGF